MWVFLRTEGACLPLPTLRSLVGNRPACSILKIEVIILVEAGLNPTTFSYGGGLSRSVNANVGNGHRVKTMIVYTLFEVIIYTFHPSNTFPSILGSP